MIEIRESEIEYSTYPIERPTLMIKCKTHQDYLDKKQSILNNQEELSKLRSIVNAFSSEDIQNLKNFLHTRVLLEEYRKQLTSKLEKILASQEQKK